MEDVCNLNMPLYFYSSLLFAWFVVASTAPKRAHDHHIAILAETGKTLLHIFISFRSDDLHEKNILPLFYVRRPQTDGCKVDTMLAKRV